MAEANRRARRMNRQLQQGKRTTGRRWGCSIVLPTLVLATTLVGLVRRRA